MRRTLCIGHSHMSKIRLAAADDPAFAFETCTKRIDGVLQNRDVREFEGWDLEAVSQVALFTRGNRHLSLCLVNRPEGPFDFFLPERTDLPINPGATLYPVALVKSVLARLMQPDLHELTLLHACFRSRPMILFESPPPTPADRIMKFPYTFAEAVGEHGVSPAAMRYKTWRLHSQLIGEWCDSHGVHFMPVPPAAIDEHGLLRDAYCRDDAAHGNLAYAELVLEQLRGLIATRQESFA